MHPPTDGAGSRDAEQDTVGGDHSPAMAIPYQDHLEKRLCPIALGHWGVGVLTSGIPHVRHAGVDETSVGKEQMERSVGIYLGTLGVSFQEVRPPQGLDREYGTATESNPVHIPEPSICYRE